MKKCMRTALILVLVAACLGTAALAADSTVTYSGNSGNFIFAPGSSESPTDLFPDFRGVMPGDTLTEQIVVRNHANKKVDVKIYMRALGAVEGSEEFLNQMKLTVTQSGQGRRSRFEEYRLQNRGGKGIRNYDTQGKDTLVAGVRMVEEGDEVILFGGSIGVDEYAGWANLNRNESLARTGRRVPRVYIEDGRVVDVIEAMD